MCKSRIHGTINVEDEGIWKEGELITGKREIVEHCKYLGEFENNLENGRGL